MLLYLSEVENYDIFDIYRKMLVIYLDPFFYFFFLLLALYIIKEKLLTE